MSENKRIALETLINSDLQLFTKECLTNAESKCALCKFWEEMEEPTYSEYADLDCMEFDDLGFSHYEGFCHRYPPIVDINNADESYYPLTNWKEWCGEYIKGRDTFSFNLTEVKTI